MPTLNAPSTTNDHHQLTNQKKGGGQLQDTISPYGASPRPSKTNSTAPAKKFWYVPLMR